MINTGYPETGFDDMYAGVEPTPEWVGFGHKHLSYQSTPIKHITLVDGQQVSEVYMQDPDEPLDHVVADQLRGQPAERAHFQVSSVLTLIPTIRQNARPDMEYGQFQQPDTRPAILEHHRRGWNQRKRGK